MKLKTYRDVEIHVDDHGKFSARDKDHETLVEKNSLEEVTAFLDKQAKIKFDRVKVLQARPVYGWAPEPRDYTPQAGEVTSVTPDGEYWVTFDRERHKRYRGEEILDTPENREAFAAYYAIEKKIDQLKIEAEKYLKKMKRWKLVRPTE